MGAVEGMGSSWASQLRVMDGVVGAVFYTITRVSRENGFVLVG